MFTIIKDFILLRKYAIAKEFDTSLVHVYRLKSGKKPKNDKDYCILLKMKEKNIIDRVFYQGDM